MQAPCPGGVVRKDKDQSGPSEVRSPGCSVLPRSEDAMKSSPVPPARLSAWFSVGMAQEAGATH